MIRIRLDENGNKIAQYSPQIGLPGFTVRTEGNMPNTHRDLLPGTEGDVGTTVELYLFVKAYGTPHQKQMLGFIDGALPGANYENN